MFLVLLLTLLLEGDAGSQPLISDTEIFQAIDVREAAVHPNGTLYLLNFDQAQIQVYGPDGKRTKNIGRKGKGPGEFTYPTFFALRGDRLYVEDMLSNAISVFDLQGTFLTSYKVPYRQCTLQRSNGGWLYFELPGGMEGGPSKLFWAVDNLTQPKEIKPIAHTGWRQGTWVMSGENGVNATFSPLDAQAKIEVSPDGKRLFYLDPTLFKIDVFDGQTGKALYQISRNDKTLPFDTEWADEKYTEQTKDSQNNGTKVTFKKLYPEKFPAIRELRFDPQGNLMIDRWRGRPDEKHYPLCLTPEGKEIPATYDWEVLRRYIGRVKDTAYVITFEGEELGITTVPVNELNTFVKDTPITDWDMSRSISISN